MLLHYLCVAVSCTFYRKVSQTVSQYLSSKQFLPRDACIKRGLSRHAVFVCLSVNVFVCHVRTFCQNG